MTPGDLALAHGDYARAESLYVTESQSGADADRAHAALIRAQLRQSKVPEAEKEAVAWSTAQPKNAWALIALSEVQWREGRPNDALRTLDTARTLDYCIPQNHADAANIYRMRGLNASALRELTLAHRLDPIDPVIGLAWLRLQPRSTRVSAITDFLASASDLSADQINSLEHEKQRLSQPAAASCHLANAVTSTSIPFRAIQDGPRGETYWGLDVAFNGKQRRLEIDTGATGLILTKSAAAALHLQPEHDFKASGIGDDGDVDSFVTRVSSIKIGSLEFQDCDVQVLGKTPMGMSAQDGLIGGDVFSHFLLTLDFPGRTLKLDPLPVRPGDTSATSAPSLDTGVFSANDQTQDAYKDPSMKDWEPVWRSGHDLLIDVRLNASGPWRLFLLDTGSSMDLISPDAAREVGKISSGSWVNVVGISGEVKKTWTTGPMNLYFSHLVAPTQGLVALDTSRLGRPIGVEISGLIGAPTLHQLTVSIDYRDYLVHFAYDPKRLHHCFAGVSVADCY